MVKNAQDFCAGVAGPFGLGKEEHHGRAVVSCLQELVDVMEAWFAGRLRVIEVERILNGAVADDEIRCYDAWTGRNKFRRRIAPLPHSRN